MELEITLSELLKFNGSYCVANCVRVAFNIGEISYNLPILKGPLSASLYKYGGSIMNYGDSKPGTYMLMNTITGNFYIGSAADIIGRIRNHRVMIKNKNHNNEKIKELSRKHTPDKFDFFIIYTTDREMAYDIEQFLLDLYKDNKFKMNVSINARLAQYGLEHTEAQRQAASANIKTLMEDPNFIIRNKEAVKEAVGRKVYAYGNVYASITEAHTTLGILLHIFRALLDNPNEPEVYFVGENVSPVLGVAHSDERKREKADRMKNDPKAIAHAKSMPKVDSKCIILNGREYSTIAEAVRKEHRCKLTIRRAMKNVVPDENGKYVFSMPPRRYPNKYFLVE